MGSVALSNKSIDRYYHHLMKLDKNSKEQLITKLSESIQKSDNASFDLKSIFGAWEDSRDSDEIIKDIRESRVNQSDREEFE